MEQNPPAPPPFAVCLIGAMLIGFGVASAIDLAMHLSDGLYLNPVVVAIFLGFSILYRNEASRLWVQFFCWIGFLGGVVMLCLQGYTLFAEKPDWMLADSGTPLAAGVLITACGWVLYALRKRSTREWFMPGDQQPRARNPITRRWAWGILVSMAVVQFPDAVEIENLKREMNGVFQIRVDLDFNDAVTGDPISDIHFGCKDLDVVGRSMELPHVYLSSRTTPDAGTQLSLSGCTTKPIQLNISSPGYEPTEIEIGYETPNKVRVELKPLTTP